jgi:hypothetical protein
MNGNVNVAINFGLSNSLSRTFPTGKSLGQVLGDPNIQAALGFGKNVVGKVDGVTQSASYILTDGDEVDIEIKANQKA